MPTTIERHKASLHQPAFSELLPVRDILNDVIIRTTGALVAGYELSGINSYYHNDDGRNRTKLALEALIRSLPERSMRMQVRFEIAEGLGDLRERYQQQLRNQNPTLLALDRMRIDAWRKKEHEGYYLRPLLHAYFHWNPIVHHELPGAAFGRGKYGPAAAVASTARQAAPRRLRGMVLDDRSRPLPMARRPQGR